MAEGSDGGGAAAADGGPACCGLLDEGGEPTGVVDRAATGKVHASDNAVEA